MIYIGPGFLAVDDLAPRPLPFLPSSISKIYVSPDELTDGRGGKGSHIKRPWMKEERDKTSSVGAYPRCPVSTSVHFSLRNEGFSENIRVFEGRESLIMNFLNF
jgi:hypothetical protein